MIFENTVKGFSQDWGTRKECLTEKNKLQRTTLNLFYFTLL
jgi:hypothetical protein